MPELDTEVFCNILYQLTDSLPEPLGWFHAQFNTGLNKGPAPVQIAEAHGRGHYAGCLLYMQGEERNYLSFLEAPEHVYVDADWEAPRIVGTGLEDYFLGGWYFREGTFIGPYHGVPVKDALNASVAMYRVHEADAIRFDQRLKFAFVNPWSPDRLKPFCFSSVAFLYLDKPDGQGAPIPPRRICSAGTAFATPITRAFLDLTTLCTQTRLSRAGALPGKVRGICDNGASG